MPSSRTFNVATAPSPFSSLYRGSPPTRTQVPPGGLSRRPAVLNGCGGISASTFGVDGEDGTE